MSTRIYHNPRCSKSRQTLQLLQEQGIEPEIIQYLQTPVTADQLQELLTLLGMQASELLRANEKLAKELALKTASEPEILQAMVENPVLIERPIVVHGNQARIGRPPEQVLEIL